MPGRPMSSSISWTSSRCEVGQRGGPVTSLEDRVALALEQRADRVAQRAVVVDDENGGLEASRPRRMPLICPASCHTGQPQGGQS